MTYPTCPSAISAAARAREATSASWLSVAGSWVPKTLGALVVTGQSLVVRGSGAGRTGDAARSGPGSGVAVDGPGDGEGAARHRPDRPHHPPTPEGVAVLPCAYRCPTW